MIYLGADHRGFELKRAIKEKLKLHNFDVIDIGAHEYDENDDYPEIAFSVAQRVGKDEKSFGILFCGSGAGMCMTANKAPGVRATVGVNPNMVKAARSEDNINVLCIAADFCSESEAWAMVELFLDTAFDGKVQHARRLDQISRYENSSSH